VIRASIDGFHHPRAFRYRRGRDSSEGYYEDSFDLPTLRRLLLNPLGLVGNHYVYTQSFDFRSDSPNLAAVTQVAPNAILLFDGVFLQRPQLAGCFDCVLFVQVSFETVLKRAMQRDAHLLGGPQAARERYLRRYIPAQQQYLRASSPAELADIIIQNDNPHNPIIIFNPKSGG
jgi:uridine kinase